LAISPEIFLWAIVLSSPKFCIHPIRGLDDRQILGNPDNREKEGVKVKKI